MLPTETRIRWLTFPIRVFDIHTTSPTHFPWLHHRVNKLLSAPAYADVQSNSETGCRVVFSRPGNQRRTNNPRGLITETVIGGWARSRSIRVEGGLLKVQDSTRKRLVS